VTYIDYDAERAARRQKIATAKATPPKQPQIEVPSDQIVPFRCDHRGIQFGTLDCGCRNATKVFTCANADVLTGLCVVEDIDRKAKYIQSLDKRDKWPLNGDLRICATCKQKRPFAWINDVAVGVTKYLRDEDLAVCLRSLQQYMPGVDVFVEDTQGNLSRGRNRLVRRIHESGKRYYFMLEEDVEITPATVVGLDEAYRLMESDPDLSSVGGAWLNDRQGRLQFWSHQFQEDDHIITMYREEHPAGEPVPCQCHENFGLFRVEHLLDEGWDESIPIGNEHWEFFYRTKHRKRLAIRTMEALHHNSRPSKLYNEARSRSYLRATEQKHGKRWINPDVAKYRTMVAYQRLILPPGHDRKPNLLITGTGRCGTGLVVQMAEKLGWNFTGEKQYFEDARFIRANQEIINNAAHSVELDEIVESLPEPWVIKDPRFIKTIETWIEIFRRQRTKPLLVVMYRNQDDVAESFARAGWEANIDMLTSLSITAFRQWPWEKWLVKYEDLLAAACLVQC